MPRLLAHPFSHTPRSRRYFNSSSRALRTACHGNSLPVMSSKHMTFVLVPPPRLPTSRVFHDCVSRGLFMIDLQDLSSLWLHISVSILQFSNFPTFPVLTSSITTFFTSSSFPPLTQSTTMHFSFCSLPAFPNSQTFGPSITTVFKFCCLHFFQNFQLSIHPSRRSRPCHS